MSSQTFVTIVLGLVEIISFSIMSRLLTEKDFGYYAAITAITTVFASFSETGIGSAIVQQKNLTRRFVNNAFTISLIFGSFISLLLLGLAGPLSRMVADVTMKVPLMLISVTLLLNCLTSVNNSIMHRRLEFFQMGAIRLVALVVTTIIAIILAYKGWGYYAILTKAILTSVITYLLSLYYCKTQFTLELDKKTFKEIFSFSGWLMASVLFRNLAHQVDRLLMPRLLSVAALGSYNRPKDFIEQISSKICGIFDTALFPILSGIQDNKESLWSAYKRSIYIMNLFSLCLSLAFIFNRELLIRIFFGEQWLYLKTVMSVISVTVLFNFVGRLADCFLRSLAMTKQQFFFRIFETILSIIGVIAGYKWEILGVAIGVTGANMIAKLFKIFYIGIKLDIHPLQITSLILSSWRYSIILVPICAIANAVLPSTWGGNFAMAAVFMVSTLVIFIFMPNFVGTPYKEEIYSKVISIIKNKLHKI